MERQQRSVGDLVWWSSQAQGCAKKKLGTIVEIIKKGDRPNLGGCGWGRDHESYVVEVKPKAGSKAKPKKYWPVASLLRPVEMSEACTNNRT